ncbi:hypothetical protein [Moraxella lacunata]|uniref:hypothetical protein n=1 Tax=Moraxella lacunata TaxID=477 RepID=UPI003EE094A6
MGVGSFSILFFRYFGLIDKIPASVVFKVWQRILKLTKFMMNEHGGWLCRSFI